MKEIYHGRILLNTNTHVTVVLYHRISKYNTIILNDYTAFRFVCSAKYLGTVDSELEGVVI